MLHRSLLSDGGYALAELVGVAGRLRLGIASQLRVSLAQLDEVAVSNEDAMKFSGPRLGGCIGGRAVAKVALDCGLIHAQP